VAVFFTDRDLGKRFPLLLAEAGVSVEPHHAHFAHDTPDDVWIAEVARRGWVAVTHNRRIRYTPNEVEAVFNSGLAMLVLIGRANTSDLAANFARTLPRVERFLARHDPPFIAKVFRPSASEIERSQMARGRIELWLDELP
jgi:hypothetical protein